MFKLSLKRFSNTSPMNGDRYDIFGTLNDIVYSYIQPLSTKT